MRVFVVSGYELKCERITMLQRGHVVLIGLIRPAQRNALDLDSDHALGIARGDDEANPRLLWAVLHAHNDHLTGGLERSQWLPFFSDGRMPPLPNRTVDRLQREERLSKSVVAVQAWCLTICRAETVACQSPVGATTTLTLARLAREAGERAAVARMLPALQQALSQDAAVEDRDPFLERRELHLRD